jgi:flavin reductase
VRPPAPHTPTAVSLAKTPPARPHVSAELFKRALRQLAAGVTLVTTDRAGERLGLTATAVCPVTTSPPTLIACVNLRSPTCSAIAQAGHFCVNVLATGDIELAQRFAAEPGGRTRFEVGQWTTRVTGAPVLESALASFDCELSGSLPAGTHVVYLGRVVEATVRAQGVPLLYGDGRYL